MDFPLFFPQGPTAFTCEEIVTLQSPAVPSPQQTRSKFKAHQDLRDPDHLNERNALDEGGVTALPLTGAVPMSRSSQPHPQTRARQKTSHNAWQPKAKHCSTEAPQKYDGKPSFASSVTKTRTEEYRHWCLSSLTCVHSHSHRDPAVSLLWRAAGDAGICRGGCDHAQGGCGVQGYSLGSQAQGPMQDLKGSLPQLLHP